MARKTKYTSENIQAIATELALNGDRAAAWKKGNISEATFYKWLEDPEKTEFREAIAQSEAEFRESCPNTQKRQAQKAFADYLFGRVEESWATMERGSDNNGSWSKETTKKVRRGTPRWAIDRVLGKPQDVIEAIKTLARAGYLPFWLVQLTQDELVNSRKAIFQACRGILPKRRLDGNEPGISDDAEIAIRAALGEEVLGIESPDITEISNKVDKRSLKGQDSGEVTTDRD